MSKYLAVGVLDLRSLAGVREKTVAVPSPRSLVVCLLFHLRIIEQHLMHQ